LLCLNALQFRQRPVQDNFFITNHNNLTLNVLYRYNRIALFHEISRFG